MTGGAETSAGEERRVDIDGLDREGRLVQLLDEVKG
jgi:hypothetical protein